MQDSLNIIQDATISEDTIEHYGVMGMKWGHRKQYAQSHNMTTRQLRKQIKADNKKAFELGRMGTATAIAEEIATKKANKAKEKFFNKKKVKTKDELKYTRALVTETRAKEAAKKARKAMEAHRKELVTKYGKTKVSEIKKNKNGRINEKVNSAKDHLSAIAATVVGTALGQTLVPVMTGGRLGMYYAQVPAGKNTYGRMLYNDYKAQSKKDVRIKKA